jgi:outer membrane protein assembly factor BamB
MKHWLALLFWCCFAVALRAADPPMLTNAWALRLGAPSDCSPAIAPDGTIYLGDFRGNFFAITPSGEKRWQFKAGAEIKSSPTVAPDGTVFFGSRDRHLYALGSDGKKRWAFRTGAWIDASPALATDGLICFGSWDKKFYAVDPSGEKRWDFAAGGPIDSSAAICADGSLRFGCHDGKFYALQADGKLQWAFDAGAPIVSSPALTPDDTAYFTAVNGFLLAVDAVGKQKWKLHTGGITRSSPVIGPDGTIYVGVNKLIWAVNPDGSKKWERVVTGDAYQRETESTPIVLADNSVLVISRYGLLLPIAAGTLHSKWYFWAGEYGGCSPAIAPDGTIYVVSIPFLHAVKTTESLAPGPWPKFRRDVGNTGAAPARR